MDNNNNELINQILSDLKSDENIDISNINIEQHQQPQVNQPPSNTHQPQQNPMIHHTQPSEHISEPIPILKNTKTRQIKPAINPAINSNDSFLSAYKTHIVYIKDFILFIAIFFIISLPQLNSLLVDFVPEDIYLILLVKGVIGSCIFSLISYFITNYKN